MDAQLAKEILIPASAFAIGATLLLDERSALPGKLSMFFGAQTLMNLYMKEVLSNTVVSEVEGLEGIPGSFIVTAIQQIVAFFLFVVVLIIAQFTPYKYTPRRLTRPTEWFAVLLFSLSFTLNIGLNNFSISLLPLSVNLIIRSCLPLATLSSQRLAGSCTGEAAKEIRSVELVLMLAGVLCAAVAVVAEEHGAGSGKQDANMLYGVVVCVLSLFAGAVNLAIAGVLGTSLKLNSLDSTVYMSVPAFLILLVPSFIYKHPISWPGYGDVTDWEVLCKVMAEKPSAVILAGISGVLAFFYNVFQYGIVHSLSASYTAFAGNFNKAATIALGIIVGLEHLPPFPWSGVMLLAIGGNIIAFTMYSIISMKAKDKVEYKNLPQDASHTRNMEDDEELQPLAKD